MEQRENAGVIKRVFLGAYSQRKVKAYDAKLSNELQSFQVCPQFSAHVTRLIRHLQAALAFNPYFVQFAAQIEVRTLSTTNHNLLINSIGTSYQRECAFRRGSNSVACSIATWTRPGHAFANKPWCESGRRE